MITIEIHDQDDIIMLAEILQQLLKQMDNVKIVPKHEL